MLSAAHLAALRESVEQLPGASALLHWRGIVERTFGWMGRYRRMSKNYEPKTSLSAVWMLIGMTRLMAARLAETP